MKKSGTLGSLKKCMVAILAAAMFYGICPGTASAIDFRASGEWLVGFGVGDDGLIGKTRQGGAKNRPNANDKFAAAQRLRLQLDAVASENLSGTVYFEIGDTSWGKADEGGALGSDGRDSIKLKNAYIDWLVPNTDLKLRMGLQGVALPNMAGGSAIMDGDVAAVVANYKLNDNVGLTATWMRPVNDNFEGWTRTNDDNRRDANYLDNIDLLALSLPISLDGFEITPWVMYGIIGKNALNGLDTGGLPDDYWKRTANGKSYAISGDPWSTSDGALGFTLTGLYPGMATQGGLGQTSKTYGSMFFAGLPLAVTALDPLNIEFDINYGYVEAMGRFDVAKRMDENDLRRGSTKREGWLVKALVEYKFDWGVPGIFAWYGSGDDGNVKNGSERMPSIAASGNFTSFMGDGNLAWAPNGNWYDKDLSYAGTWGVGLQVRDVSFMEDLSHTLRVAYWGGTNNPSMVKYMKSPNAWEPGYGTNDGPYLTTNDGLLEFNLVNSWKIYENLEMNLEASYMVNMIDSGTWNRSYFRGNSDIDSYQKQDAWKVQAVFAYTF